MRWILECAAETESEIEANWPMAETMERALEWLNEHGDSGVLDRHGRMVARIEPVMSDLIHIGPARQIDRADEPVLDVPGQVARIEEPEGTEIQPQHDAVAVIALVDRFRLVLGANFAGFLSAADRGDEAANVVGNILVKTT